MEMKSIDGDCWLVRFILDRSTQTEWVKLTSEELNKLLDENEAESPKL